MKEKIKELFDDYQTNDWTIFELEKRVLNLFNVGRTLVCDCSRKGKHLGIEERQNKCIHCKKPIAN